MSAGRAALAACVFGGLIALEPLDGPPLPPASPAKEEGDKKADGDKPARFEGRGRLVCIPEEMRSLWGAEVPPVHEHVLGLKAEETGTKGAAPPGYYVLLRTRISEGLFADERFRAQMLVITGRLFPGTSVCEVSSYQWIKDGKLHDVYYWCEVCAIKGRDPGPCACCQGKVELREAAVEKR